MVDAFTSTDPSTLGTSLVQTAYDRAIAWELWPDPLFRKLATKKPVAQAMPGETVVMQLADYLSPATTPLDEVTDVSAVASPTTRSVSVTLQEWGNAMVTTMLLRQVALADVDPIVAHQIAINMKDSLDGIIEPVLRGGSNFIRGNGGTLYSNLKGGGNGTVGAIAAGDTFKSTLPRFAVTKFRAQSVQPYGSDFVVFLHPDQSHDLRSETGSGGWRQPQEYFNGTGIWNGQIGSYEGASYIESPRIYSATDGASSARVYRSFALGREALAEACAIEPGMRIGPVTDKLMRFRTAGWYGLCGWSRYREEALIRIETSSSVAA
ncbi:N4-gp56 family major capsid protein [Actinocorallia libanotica]|uniref:N4-gp56 family major capsid protein n=1 Tax=Actinocorallia libanotica TaxID=46162 RepID=A0ABN1Q1M7_9ACTN